MQCFFLQICLVEETNPSTFWMSEGGVYFKANLNFFDELFPLKT